MICVVCLPCVNPIVRKANIVVLAGVLLLERGVIRLKRIYNFLCSMRVYAPFALCFVYTLWSFYAFFETNLLTRCHSASSLFSAVFVFQKIYTENILGIGRNKS
jgi:hypothetical protein